MTWWPIPLFAIGAAAFVYALLNYREKRWSPPDD